MRCAAASVVVETRLANLPAPIRTAWAATLSWQDPDPLFENLRHGIFLLMCRELRASSDSGELRLPHHAVKVGALRRTRADNLSLEHLHRPIRPCRCQARRQLLTGTEPTRLGPTCSGRQPPADISSRKSYGILRVGER
jgi:hypothetical protein